MAEQHCDILMIDMSNLLHRTFYVNAKEEFTTLLPLAWHASMNTLNKYYKKYKPGKVVFVFDRSSWRKQYTQTEQCISKRLYKGTRRQNMTPSEKERYDLFKAFISDFESLMRQHSGIICLAGDGLEADDLMAGVTQVYQNVNIVMVSADKDLIQLLANPNVKLMDPITQTYRNLDEWNGDAGYFIFEKCVRGDTGDNVASAWPKVRSTKIEQAYADEYARINFMQHEWKINRDGEPVTMVVGECFKENVLLMDLTAQPHHIREQLVAVIHEGFNKPGKYSHFHFLKFLGKYQLKSLTKQLEVYTPLLMGGVQKEPMTSLCDEEL